VRRLEQVVPRGQVPVPVQALEQGPPQVPELGQLLLRMGPRLEQMPLGLLILLLFLLNEFIYF
jgi:hypothetical protein